ncbi:MAG: DUF1573 domain-containing protein [Bacteroidota bacterium]
MKKLQFIIGLLLLSVSVHAQDESLTAEAKPLAPLMSLEADAHDFGQIKQGEPVTATFKFVNTGALPLIITNAKGSCGCTVPSYTKEPIAPNATGEIMATYNAANKGVFTKTVTVTTNEGQSRILRIKGEVIE